MITSNRRHGLRRDVVVVVVLAVVAVVVGLLLVLRGGDEPDPAAGVAKAPGPSTTATAVGPLGDLARRLPGDPMALGRPDAPLVMVMFTDFRCPFCAQFGRDTEEQLVRDYVDPGRMRIEWRDYAIFGPQSTAAAAAGRAAAAQGRFWEYNRAIFADAPDRGHADLDDVALVGYAGTVGVPDLARFERDMHSPQAAGSVQADLDEASALGVPSTPAFVINGNPLLGAQPIETFRAQIDAVLGGMRR